MNAATAESNLPAARQALADAIHTLAGRTTTTIDGHPYWGDSLYLQLREAIPGEQGSQLGATARSMPPMWVDAADKLHEIDTRVEEWHGVSGWEHSDLPATVYRLYDLADLTWRPQDTVLVQCRAEQIEVWAREIRQLLDPAPKWSLPNPCPACDTKTVYRKDSAGETVRQPALQIGPLGCECLKCRTVWGPAYFTHLARVLGYEMPAGVLE